MLVPKKVKHRKHCRGKNEGVSHRGSSIDFGSYGLRAEENVFINSRQIEAARRAIIRYLRKGGKLWIRIFPYKPITKKGQEVPMGGGKGTVDHYAFPVKRGRILFEIEGISEEKAKEAFSRAADKLPTKTKFVKKI